MFEEVISSIKEYERIIIHRHTSPDGDAIGSQTGLKYLIKDNFPEKEVYAVGDGAGRYSFVEGCTPDTVDDDTYNGALAIILDTSASHLISDTRYKLANKTVRIDHHIFCEKIADIEVTDTSYESCAGMIAELAKECSLTLSPASASALYTGMITDSGRFRYDSVNSNTFRLASFIRETPFDTTRIFTSLYSDDFSMIRLRAKYVLKICFTEKNVAYIYTPIEEAKSYGVSDFTLSRGMVNTMSEIKGVSIWVNFTETESGVLTEIRSSAHNINPVAVKYGGGGHAKASGATLKNKDEAMALLADLDLIAEGKN